MDLVLSCETCGWTFTSNDADGLKATTGDAINAAATHRVECPDPVLSWRWVQERNGAGDVRYVNNNNTLYWANSTTSGASSLSFNGTYLSNGYALNLTRETVTPVYEDIVLSQEYDVYDVRTHGVSSSVEGFLVSLRESMNVLSRTKAERDLYRQHGESLSVVMERSRTQDITIQYQDIARHMMNLKRFIPSVESRLFVSKKLTIQQTFKRLVCPTRHTERRDQ